MKYALFLLLGGICSLTFAQNTTNVSVEHEKHPRLIVGIVIDQMRWDYLYQFKDRYKKEGAFRRLIENGFECKNAHYNYVPTVTAAGHACVYTGALPSMNGIVGNDWYETKKKRYCTQDDTYGSSPRNLWTTTITDELRLAYQFSNKVFGIALKDRGAILPAGHHPNGAFWYDTQTGNWTTSSYYPALPDWVKKWNEKKMVNSLYKQDWNTLYPIKSYKNYPFQEAMIPYYSNPFAPTSSTFPYRLSTYINKDFSKIASTPWGNTLTISFAKSLIEREQLGDKETSSDFLAISFSSPDYIGHQFGPNSVELEDNYLRLDQELGEFMDYLEKKFGKDYVLFLTADHAVNNIPQFLQQHQLPGGLVDEDSIVSVTNAFGEAQYGIRNLVEHSINEQLYLNKEAISAKNLPIDDVIDRLKEVIQSHFSDGIAFVVNYKKAPTESLPHSLHEKIQNGYNPLRSGDIYLVLKSGYLMSKSNKGTSHFSAYAYDTHIPLLFYGWGINAGSTIREVHTVDIAPTLSQLLHIQMPSGCVGLPIAEIFHER